MSILQEILTWSESLPAWQSDAIARLFAKGAIADADLQDLFALLKAEHGIPWSRQGELARLTAGDAIPVGRDGACQPARIRTPGFLPVH